MIYYIDIGYNFDVYDSYFIECRVNFIVVRIYFGEKIKKKSFRIIF